MLKKICLICAAVVITWVTLLILMWLGYAIDKTLIAILMGMSVGAIATKYAPNMMTKSLVVILGLPLVWLTVNNQLGYAILVLIIILLGLLLIAKINSKKGAQQVDRFKDCC